jgi:hypothetical protein
MIARKDDPAKVKRSPYNRYVLLVHTDEPDLVGERCPRLDTIPFREWPHVQYQPALPGFAASNADNAISLWAGRNQLFITPAPSVCTGADSIDRCDATALFCRNLPSHGLIALAVLERSLKRGEALVLRSLVQRWQIAGVLGGGERTCGQSYDSDHHEPVFHSTPQKLVLL